MSARLLLALPFFLLACQSEREKELRALWAAAVETDTIDGYISFLAQQLPEEDGRVGSIGPYDDRKEVRSRTARKRVFELAVEIAHGTCPFTRLGVTVDQNIRNMSYMFSPARTSLADGLRLLGVEFGPSDQTVQITLRGEAFEGAFFSLGGGSDGGTTIVGGQLEGQIALLPGAPEPRPFQGRIDSVGMLSSIEIESAKRDFPSSMEQVLEEAGLNSAFAGLIYQACGSEAAALLYFGDAIDDLCGASKHVDLALEASLADEIDRVRPIAIAAAFGSAGRLQCYDASEKALNFVMRSPGPAKGEIASAWANALNVSNLPDGLVIPDE